MTIAIYILASLFLCLLIFVSVVTKKSRQEERHRIIQYANQSKISLNWAVAGSDSNCHTPNGSTVDVYGIGASEYKDANGKTLNIDDYDKFVVSGESMKFCGIHDKDLIFATKGLYSELDLSRPEIIVVRKHTICDNKPAYKIRRAWMATRYDGNLMEVLKNIIHSESFQQIRKLPEYDGDTALIDDFKNNRLPKYEETFIECENPNPHDLNIVISTTYHTDIEKIRFSIHPLNFVKGKVVASFGLSENQIRN